MPRKTRTSGFNFGEQAEVQRLLLRLHASNDIASFWTAIQNLLGQVTAHDALVVYLNFFDFASSWQAARILATPNASRPTTWFEGRRQVDMTPGFVLARKEQMRIYRLSDVIPDRVELERTAFFREYLAPNGWHHLAVALFWRGGTVCSEIAMRRTAAQGDFSAAEIRRLHELYPHIETVLDRLIVQEEEQARRLWLEKFNDHLPFALLFLSFELEPLYVNREGMEQCVLWNHGPEQARVFHAKDVFRVPADIATACQELKQRWLARNSKPEGSETTFSRRFTHPAHASLVASVALQAEAPTHAARPVFAIHLFREAEVSTASASLPMRSMLARLTGAERDIVRLVAAGKSNAKIAGELRKSIYTVKGQLTQIYKKLGVASRSQLLASMR